jgi:hypothetical protein
MDKHRSSVDVTQLHYKFLVFYGTHILSKRIVHPCIGMRMHTPLHMHLNVLSRERQRAHKNINYFCIFLLQVIRMGEGVNSVLNIFRSGITI